MNEFRPISLCNTSYKIIAKTIANRFKKVLDTIISPSQVAFVLGRLISYNVLIGFEYIHAISNRKKGKEDLIAIKLDMSEAYDRDEWPFIKEMLLKMRFSDKWTSNIMRCVKFVSFSVMINGFALEGVQAKQRDKARGPLFPLPILSVRQWILKAFKQGS